MIQKIIIFVGFALLLVAVSVSPEKFIKARDAIIFSSGAISLPPSAEGYLVAPVFGRYPNDVQSNFLIAKGELDGLKVGDAVVLAPRAGQAEEYVGNNKESVISLRREAILLGVISETYPEVSKVMTVRDPSWRLGVRVGKLSLEGVLMGGLEPKIGLIPANSPVSTGDVAYSADSRIPFGLNVGTVLETHLTTERTFQEALVNIPVDVGMFPYVYVVTNYVVPRDNP